MNFNDEGQSRGFWIHEFENGNLIKGHRYDTPYREFQTITWSQDEVGSYLREGKMFLMNEGYPSTVANKIVRIKYNCTSEQKKALNIRSCSPTFMTSALSMWLILKRKA